MNRLLRTKDGTAFDVLGLGVLGAILAVAAIAAFLIAPLVSLYRHPPTRVTKALDQNKALAAHENALTHQVAMVNGRSWFFDPSPPDANPIDTRKATFYGGPSLVAYVNGTAWFSDGQKVSAKEPNAKTLKFISSNAPWSIRVGWEGGEFDVKLFDKTDIASLRDSASSSLSNSPFSNSRPPSTGAGTTPAPSGEAPLSLSGKILSDRPDAPPAARLGPGPGGAGGDTPPPPPPGGPGSQPEPAPAQGAPAPQPNPPSPAPAPAPGSPSPSEPPKDPESSRPNQP